MHVCTHTPTYTHTCIHACDAQCTGPYVHMYYIYVCIYVCMYVCVCVCVSLFHPFVILICARNTTLTHKKPPFSHHPHGCQFRPKSKLAFHLPNQPKQSLGKVVVHRTKGSPTIRESTSNDSMFKHGTGSNLCVSP
jgi:hypothetical protein